MPTKDCPPGKIVNPATNRCVDRNGALGRKIVRQTNQPTKNQIHLPQDMLENVWGYLPYNCGSFIRDMRAKYGDLNAANKQVKGRLRMIVVQSLEEFKSRLSESHYINRSFLRDPQMPLALQVPLGIRVAILIREAKSTHDMNVLIELCKNIVEMKSEAVSIVAHIRRFVHYLQVFVQTGAVPQDWVRSLVVPGTSIFNYANITMLKTTSLNKARRRIEKNLATDEVELDKLLQTIHVKDFPRTIPEI